MIRFLLELGRQGRHNSLWAHRTPKTGARKIRASAAKGQASRSNRCYLGLGKILQGYGASGGGVRMPVGAWDPSGHKWVQITFNCM